MKTLPHHLTALLAAVGMLSIMDNIMTLDVVIRRVVENYQLLSHTFWSWTMSIFNLSIPGGVADYLTMGLIASGMRFRAFKFLYDTMNLDRVWHVVPYRLFWLYEGGVRPLDWRHFYFFAAPLRSLQDLFFWPVSFLLMVRSYFRRDYQRNYGGKKISGNDEFILKSKSMYHIYFESIVLFLIVLALNFILLKFFR